MYNKVKEIYPCNLLELRKNLGLTQKELGEILGVSERMICNYETGEITLPIDKAIILSQRWNYTLDWIYCFPANGGDEPTLVSKEEKCPKFLVDIREFISYSNGLPKVTFPNYYMEYIKKRNIIESSIDLADEKKRKLAELDGKYEIKKEETRYCVISFTGDNLSSYLCFDSKLIPFADFQYDSENEATKEETEEVSSLLKESLTFESEESI